MAKSVVSPLRQKMDPFRHFRQDLAKILRNIKDNKWCREEG